MNPNRKSKDFKQLNIIPGQSETLLNKMEKFKFEPSNSSVSVMKEDKESRIQLCHSVSK